MIEPRGSVMNTDGARATDAQARKTALLVGGVLLLIAAWNLYRGRITVVVIFASVGALLLVAGLFAASLRVEGPLQRAALLTGAANALVAVGFLGLFSIGLPLLIAAGAAMPSVARALTDAPRPWGPTIAATAALAAVAVIIVGLLAT